MEEALLRLIPDGTGARRGGVSLWFALSLCLISQTALSANLLTLEPGNVEEFAPKGKEADAMYGDYVLRNDKIVAVIFNRDLITGRSASRATTGGLERGSIIDLTLRREPPAINPITPQGSSPKQEKRSC